MEYIEDNQVFDKDLLPDVVSLDDGEIYFDDKGNEYVLEGGEK